MAKRKQVDALLRAGLIGGLWAKLDSFEDQHPEFSQDPNLKELRELIDLLWRAKNSHLRKKEKARFHIK